MAAKGLNLPIAELKELIGILLTKGIDRNLIPVTIGNIVDQAINFEQLIPGPVGMALEFIDGPVATALARFLLAVIPDKKLVEFASARQGLALTPSVA